MARRPAVRCAASPGSSVSASPMYSRTTIDDASAGMCSHCAPSSSAAAGSSPTARARTPPIELEVGVAEVAGHPSRGQPRPGEHLEAEVGGRPAGSGDPVGTVAADHRQQVSAVGVGAADQPGGGAHVEEPRPLAIGLDATAPSTVRSPGAPPVSPSSSSRSSWRRFDRSRSRRRASATKATPRALGAERR